MEVLKIMLVFLYTDEDSQITYRYYVGGSGVQIIIENIIVTNFNKIAIKYKANDFAIWINGIEVGTASSGSLNPSGTFNQLAFARGGANNTPFYGSTKQLQYFDSALNDSDLEKLTSWVSFSDMANGQQYSIPIDMAQKLKFGNENLGDKERLYVSL